MCESIVPRNKITCSELGAGTENQMNGDRCVVHVLSQRLAQHTHVLFKVVPQEVEDIEGPGVDHVTNSLPQDTTKHQSVTASFTFTVPVICQMWRSLSLFHFWWRLGAWRGVWAAAGCRTEQKSSVSRGPPSSDQPLLVCALSGFDLWHLTQGWRQIKAKRPNVINKDML